jgi:hypothetical protein
VKQKNVWKCKWGMPNVFSSSWSKKNKPRKVASGKLLKDLNFVETKLPNFTETFFSKKRTRNFLNSDQFWSKWSLIKKHQFFQILYLLL